MNKVVIAAFVAALCFVGGAIAADEEGEAKDKGHVVALTKDNFDSIVNKAETILVKFFAPWCGHCKHLAPEYIKAANVLEKDGEGVILAEVDATTEPDLAKRFDVHGYPTLFLFHNGVKSEYKGPREADGIVKYLRGQAGPAAKPLANAEELEAFLARAADVKFVAYTKAGSSLAKFYAKNANVHRENFLFGISEPTATYTDKIVAHRNFGTEEKEAAYSGKTKDDEIAKWIKEVTLPLAGVYDESTKARYGSLPILFVYSKVNVEKDPSGLRYILNRLRPVAADYKGKLHFVAADNAHDKKFDEMNLKSSEKFQIAIVDGDKLYKSSLVAMKKEAIKEFVDLFLAGKAEQFIKSEEVPAEAKEGEVVVVVGQTFDQIVTKTETDTLFVAHAPWCGHCKELMPTLDKLAKKFNVAGSTVRIAKSDATNNYVPSAFQVRGFPSMFWVPAGKGAKPSKFEGGREFDDIEKYINSHKSKDSKPLAYAAAPKATDADDKKEL